MLETGMVRRIDDLGRIVIPKEMRKTLHLKEGDPIEIFTDREQLILKKYSPITSIKTYAETVAEGLTETMDKACVVTDTDSIIYVSGIKFKNVLGEKISSDLQALIRSGKSIISSNSDGGKIISPVHDENFQAENQIIVPIIKDGDSFGALIVFDKDKASRFNSSDLKLVTLGATFLAKQFQV